MKTVTVAACLTLLAAGLFAVNTEKGRLDRNVLRNIERNFDGKLRTTPLDESFDVMGTTRGVYLEGYGAVFTTEINLLPSATISPFMQQIPPAYRARLHKRKIERLALLKQTMRGMMIASAGLLKDLPADQQIVLGVSIFYYSWEDTTDLPTQVVMKASRDVLLKGAALENSIVAEEY